MIERVPQQERSRITREGLLRAAVDVLAEQGWAAATVATVAARAGVSRGAAQHHFPTRESLVTATLERLGCIDVWVYSPSGRAERFAASQARW